MRAPKAASVSLARVCLARDNAVDWLDHGLAGVHAASQNRYPG
jgi:hypothetical protein